VEVLKNTVKTAKDLNFAQPLRFLTYPIQGWEPLGSGIDDRDLKHLTQGPATSSRASASSELAHPMPPPYVFDIFRGKMYFLMFLGKWYVLTTQTFLSNPKKD